MVFITIVTGAFVNQQTSPGGLTSTIDIYSTLEKKTMGEFYVAKPSEPTWGWSDGP